MFQTMPSRPVPALVMPAVNGCLLEVPCLRPDLFGVPRIQPRSRRSVQAAFGAALMPATWANVAPTGLQIGLSSQDILGLKCFSDLELRLAHPRRRRWAGRRIPDIVATRRAFAKQP